jgi:hypothetical protein
VNDSDVSIKDNPNQLNQAAIAPHYPVIITFSMHRTKPQVRLETEAVGLDGTATAGESKAFVGDCVRSQRLNPPHDTSDLSNSKFPINVCFSLDQSRVWLLVPALRSHASASIRLLLADDH